MERMKIVSCALVLLGTVSVGWTQESQVLQQENAQLRRRLERLENAIEELRKAAVARGSAANPSSAAPTTPANGSTASEGVKNLQQENAQLRQRLEKLESAWAPRPSQETKKPSPSTPAEPKSPAPIAPSQAAAGPGTLKSPTGPAQPLAATPVERNEPAATTQPSPVAVPSAPKSPTPVAPPQTPVAPVEPRAPTPTAQPLSVGAPSAPKELVPMTPPQPAAAPVEPKGAILGYQAQSAGTPAESKKATEVLKPAAAAPANGKKSVLSSLDVEIYGIVKADASYDTSRTNPGNYVVWVDSEATNKNDNEFNVTANQTRLGVRVGGPSSDTLKTSGLVEFDFYGNYASENKAKIQMRHAYVMLDWPKSRFSVLAGQTSDIVAPLAPNTLNYTVLWDAGNIGYRRPQLRATQTLPLGEKSSLKLEVGAARTIGRTTPAPTNSETGEDAGWPTAQGRVSASFPLLNSKPTTIGVSGHYGQEEWDLNAAGRHTNFESWSANVDITQPVAPWLTILGEWFYGRNLDQYFGGIGQGVNTTSLKELDATGGWIAASLGPWSQWSFNVGAGVDSIRDDDLATGGRTQNSSIFGNVYYSWNKNAQFGVELSRWNTLYKGVGDAEDWRAQTSFLYKF